ncbi:restriction endonuclease subunit S [Paraprevotella xylaniphila]|uniref:restriction endonuclease subunit S n=1 Tax=Paraprevotella xylaniphila TaxID=454155 RepID=UPI001032FA13|nr:restriction endonuclease subunit S [Paraprevotella xylaniphila]
MNGLKTVTIGFLGNVVTGSTPPKKDKDNYGDYALWIKPTDINENEKYTRSTEEMFSKKSAEQCKSRIVPKDSICVPCIGTIGTKLTMTPCDCFVNQSINAIIPNEDFDNHYAYYLLRNFLPSLKLHNKGTASGREFIAKAAFEEIEIKVFEDKQIQQKIGLLLSAYDNLIDNYRCQIKLLEEAAQRLYKEWFVDLRFPGYEQTKIVDGVPEGWEKTDINSIMTFHRGYDLTRSNMQYGKYPVVGSTSVIGYHNKYKIHGPGIVTGRSGSLGKYQLIWEDFWPHNTSLYISDMKEHHFLYLYGILQTVDFSVLNNGGAIPTLNRNTLSAIKMLKAPKLLQEQYVGIVEPYYNIIRNVEKEIILLTEARDRLLPKLMSGEIKV